MYHFSQASEIGSQAAPSAPGIPLLPLPALLPRGSLRRVLDLLLRKPAYLDQFGCLETEVDALSRLPALLISVGRREGVISISRSHDKAGCFIGPLTDRGRELLVLLDDLARLDRLAEGIDSNAMIALCRRRAGRVTAPAVRRVLRTRGAPRWLCLMPDGGFDAEALFSAAELAETAGILRLFRAHCLVERIPLTPRRTRRYRLTGFGLGVREFVRRLAELDGGPDATPDALRFHQLTSAVAAPREPISFTDEI